MMNWRFGYADILVLASLWTSLIMFLFWPAFFISLLWFFVGEFDVVHHSLETDLLMLWFFSLKQWLHGHFLSGQEAEAFICKFSIFLLPLGNDILWDFDFVDNSFGHFRLHLQALLGKFDGFVFLFFAYFLRAPPVVCWQSPFVLADLLATA